MFDREAPNPYTAPTADLTAAHVAPPDEVAEAEAVRRKYLGHEASVKSVGSLYTLGGLFGLIATGVLASMALNRNQMLGNANAQSLALMWGMIAFYFLLTILNFALACGLNRLQAWARWTVIVLSGLSLAYVLFLGVVVMLRQPAMGAAVTLISGGITAYILYLMASPKGAMVFSPEYKAIIALTPHVKYRSSPLVKVLLVLFVVVVIIAFVAVFNR